MTAAMPPWFWPLAAFLFGAVVGSFLNVCIWRLPREESIVLPPSHCPACGAHIQPWDNVPIISWIFLRGRCRSCGGRISWRYPLVELLNAVLWTVFLLRLGARPQVLPYLVLASAMVVIVFIDLDHYIIPDTVTLPGIVLGLALTPLLPHRFLDGVIGAAAGGLFFYLTAVVSAFILKQEGMGMGDVKMAAMMGAFLGWRMLLVAVFLALLGGSGSGLLLIALGRRRRRDPIPFGPFLAAGTIIAALWGERLLDWYLFLGY